LDCDVDGGAFAGRSRGREDVSAHFDALCSILQEYGAVEVAYSLSITRRGGESVDSSSAVLFKRMGADLAVAKGSQEGEGERQLCFV
jgi:hypothetical protein